MKILNKLLKHNKNIYQKLNFLNEEKTNILAKNTNHSFSDKSKEFNTGLIVIIAIILIIISLTYYLMVFQPQMQQLQDHKTKRRIHLLLVTLTKHLPL